MSLVCPARGLPVAVLDVGQLRDRLALQTLLQEAQPQLRLRIARVTYRHFRRHNPRWVCFELGP